MSSTWVRIGTNHSKLKRWAVHGWEEVWTNKKSGTWVRTHPQLTKSIIVLHIWLTVITRGLSPQGVYAISTTTAPTFFATLHASGGFLVTWVDYKFITVPLTQNLFSHRPNRIMGVPLYYVNLTLGLTMWESESWKKTSFGLKASLTFMWNQTYWYLSRLSCLILLVFTKARCQIQTNYYTHLKGQNTEKYKIAKF